MKLIIALIMLLSSIMLIISSNVDKEIAELDRLISLQKNKLAQLKQQKDSSNSNSKRVVDSKSSVEVNNNINEPLTVLDNVFTNKFKYHVDYNIIDARILVTKLRPRYSLLSLLLLTSLPSLLLLILLLLDVSIERDTHQWLKAR